MATLCRFPW